MNFSYVFGPVRSGRLGLSLGLDLLGAPICTMDCLYCEVGRTRALTARRKAYVCASDLLAELAAYRDGGSPIPEYLTLGGMGEPTLNIDMPEIISGARAIYPGIPVAVLTNATALTDPEVRRELLAVDVVLPSLDSLVPQEFSTINRPVQGVTADAVADSLLTFRKEFSGKIFLEILLVQGVNDTQENLTLLSRYIPRLAPDRVDVCTMTRPGAYSQARPVDADVLAAWRAALGAVTAPKEHKAAAGRHLSDEELADHIQSSVLRRPQSVADLAVALGAEPERVLRIVERFVAQGGHVMVDGCLSPANVRES